MQLNKLSLIICFLSVILLVGSSCTFVKKRMLGVKLNFRLEQSPDQIRTFYQKFSEKTNCNIFSFKDSASLKAFNESYQNQAAGKYPCIYLERENPKQLLKIYCFDDILDNVDSINAGSYDALISHDTNIVKVIKSALVDDCEKVSGPEIRKQGTWRIYIVYIQYLGNYIRNRFVDITKVENVSELNILDFSILK